MTLESGKLDWKQRDFINSEQNFYLTEISEMSLAETPKIFTNREDLKFFHYSLSDEFTFFKIKLRTNLQF